MVSDIVRAFRMTHDVKKDRFVFVCFVGCCACLTETQERLRNMQAHCAAEYKLRSFMEAVLWTLAGAKSGLHLAFVIRAGLFTP